MREGVGRHSRREGVGRHMHEGRCGEGTCMREGVRQAHA